VIFSTPLSLVRQMFAYLDSAIGFIQTYFY
jgi:hypothetical protein